MQRIGLRIENLEARHDGDAVPHELLVRYIRPGDMACVSEARLNLRTGETVETTFIPDDLAALDTLNR